MGRYAHCAVSKSLAFKRFCPSKTEYLYMGHQCWWPTSVNLAAAHPQPTGRGSATSERRPRNSLWTRGVLHVAHAQVTSGSSKQRVGDQLVIRGHGARCTCNAQESFVVVQFFLCAEAVSHQMRPGRGATIASWKKLINCYSTNIRSNA